MDDFRAIDDMMENLEQSKAFIKVTGIVMVIWAEFANGQFFIILFGIGPMLFDQ